VRASSILTLGLLIGCAGLAVANNISGVSSVTNGSIVSAASVTDLQSLTQLGGIATAQFSDGSSVSCSFSGSGVCTAAQFSLTASGTAGFGTYGTWTIQNSNNTGGVTMTGLTVSLSGGAFNPCFPINTSNSGCTGVTAGTGFALSVSQAANFSGSASSAQATVAYTNAVQIGSTVSPDLFTQIFLSFNTSPFSGGQSFTFQADTDLLGGAGGGATPEPTTISLVGAALLGLGWFRLKTRP
jgi:hypothetical protein